VSRSCSAHNAPTYYPEDCATCQRERVQHLEDLLKEILRWAVVQPDNQVSTVVRELRPRIAVALAEGSP
jgi:hypothetical protein